MICELCGTEFPKTRRVIIEGTPLNVCSNCAKFGTPVTKEQARKESPVLERLERKQYRPRDIYEREVDILVKDFSTRIREARMRMDISQEEFGKQLNEKWSVINKLETGDLRPDDKLVAKLETGDLRPDDKLVAKLERALGITLREKLKSTEVEKKTTGKALTIGDLIREAKE